MDDSYTINDDLRACGLPGDDEDDLGAGDVALIGRSAAPINVDGTAAPSPTASPTPTPSSTPSPTASTASSSQGQGKKGNKKRSRAWDDFDEVFEDCPNGKKVRVSARCKHCKETLSGRSVYGTGHLLRHVKICPAKKDLEHKKQLQSRLAFSSDGSFYNWEYKPEVARMELCRLIARLDLPLGFGESDAFEEYIQRAHNPRFVKVSRRTTTRDFEKLFVERRASLIDCLKSSISSVCLTSDIWSGNAKEDYISVVAHYVSDDWEMHKKVIALHLIDVSHSGINIADKIESVLIEFGLMDKIFSVTLDNASSNSSAMNILIPKFVGYLGPDPVPVSENDANQPKNSLLHQRCACHIINLIVKSGLKRIKTYLEAFRTAISFLNSSNQRIAAFNNFCLVKKVTPRKFGLDMDVRWNSTYLMLKHLIPYKNTFSVFIGAHYGLQNGQPLLTESHWQVAEFFLQFLALFYDSTVALSGVYYPTAPLMLHHILELANHLHSQEQEPFLRSVVVPMKLKFLKYWQKIPLLYSFAFVLDPRAKMRGFQNVLQLLSDTVGSDYSGYFVEARTELYKLFNKYECKFGSTRAQRVTQPAPSSGKKGIAWGLIYGASSASGLGCYPSVIAPRPPLCPTSELSTYLDSDTISCFSDDFDILSWWRDHKLTYPILSILARDVLAVPVSTVSSESCFSLTGRVIEERRRRLLPETVEMLTCVKDWELGDSRAQHDVEQEVMEIEELYYQEQEQAEGQVTEQAAQV